MFTVGPVAENAYLFRRDDSREALLVDPGDEAERLAAAIAELGVDVKAILLTHTHFDHVGAVAPLARATGAPVYCPEIEVPVLADIMSFVPWPGFGPFESYDADETVSGGERLELAGFEIDVLFTPGHSPGHVTYSIADEAALFSGDVLFQGSVGSRRPPRRGLADAGGEPAHAGRGASGGDEGLPGAHGHDDAGSRAGDQPVPPGPGARGRLKPACWR